MSESPRPGWIRWPLTTKVNGEPDVVRDSNGEVVWGERKAPPDLTPGMTLSPLITTVGGKDEFVFDDDGEIIAAEVTLEQP